ncbi:MAG: hypothetical protein KAU62_11120 [Candidatus Heimdallarchaeota archaeon]|nr:hypothetical protein [Candidatus Heimdallarchaeota archaeon]MCG3256632.1 hypothetical protein [Candidatus Heimdallarchaeota archaeon]MCK4611697.1 hypothetical protein [Candidatus Heimdallarchaeota archaeon]
MSEKRKFNIWIPDSTAESIPDLVDLVEQLLYYFPYIFKVDLEELKKKDNLEKELEEVNKEFNQISQIYGKLRQEYGVIHFEANELYTRNTLTGLKLGMLMKKLEKAKSIWGPKLSLDYDSAKEIIKHYSDRYLLKREEEI